MGMPNAKVQSSKEAQSLNIKIWILELGIHLIFEL
jgi:hypothetical protein